MSALKKIVPDTVHTNIEDTIFDSYLPVNTLAMLERLKEVIKENKTNNLERCTSDTRIQRLMWLIMNQYGHNDFEMWKAMKGRDI